MTKSHLAAATLVAVALLAVVGCAPADDNGQQAWSDNTVKEESAHLKELGYKEQASALADGSVTAEEYGESYNNLRECIEAGGYTVSGSVVSPLTNTTYEFTYNSNGLDQDAALKFYDKCEAKYWLPISTIYRDTAPQRVDAVLAEAITSCMRDKGEVVDGSPKTFRDIVGDGGSRREAASDCAFSEMERLYPELPMITVVG